MFQFGFKKLSCTETTLLRIKKDLFKELSCFHYLDLSAVLTL